MSNQDQVLSDPQFSPRSHLIQLSRDEQRGLLVAKAASSSLPPFQFPPLPLSLHCWLTGLGGEFRRRHDRCLAALLVLDCREASWVQPIIPAQSCGAEGSAWSLDWGEQALAGMLLNLAAALRLRSWERAGLTSRLPADLPSVDSALAAMTACSHGQTPDEPTRIPRAVFRASIEHFAQEGQANLSADIMLDTRSGETLLQQFAAFLLAASQRRKERADERATEESC